MSNSLDNYKKYFTPHSDANYYDKNIIQTHNNYVDAKNYANAVKLLNDNNFDRGTRAKLLNGFPQKIKILQQDVIDMSNKDTSKIKINLENTEYAMQTSWDGFYTPGAYYDESGSYDWNEDDSEWDEKHFLTGNFKCFRSMTPFRISAGDKLNFKFNGIPCEYIRVVFLTSMNTSSILSVKTSSSNVNSYNITVPSGANYCVFTMRFTNWVNDNMFGIRDLTQVILNDEYIKVYTIESNINLKAGIYSLTWNQSEALISSNIKYNTFGYKIGDNIIYQSEKQGTNCRLESCSWVFSIIEDATVDIVYKADTSHNAVEIYDITLEDGDEVADENVIIKPYIEYIYWDRELLQGKYSNSNGKYVADLSDSPIHCSNKNSILVNPNDELNIVLSNGSFDVDVLYYNNSIYLSHELKTVNSGTLNFIVPQNVTNINFTINYHSSTPGLIAFLTTDMLINKGIDVKVNDNLYGSTEPTDMTKGWLQPYE